MGRGHDFEIVKQVSLRQANPLALLVLHQTGKCTFGLPEVIYDMDFPGHYMRRIKSVSLSIPCVVGPYTNSGCTLRLTSHRYRTARFAKNGGDYVEKADDTETRFATVNVPINAIATSSGQNDSGVFELNFRDERSCR